MRVLRFDWEERAKRRTYASPETAGVRLKEPVSVKTVMARC